MRDHSASELSVVITPLVELMYLYLTALLLSNYYVQLIVQVHLFIRLDELFCLQPNFLNYITSVSLSASHPSLSISLHLLSIVCCRCSCCWSTSNQWLMVKGSDSRGCCCCSRELVFERLQLTGGIGHLSAPLLVLVLN